MENIQKCAEKFRVLASPLRLEILRFLSRGERCVCEICENLGLQQSRASYHLRIMVEAGLIQQRTERTWSYYRLASDLETWVKEQIDQFLTSS